MYGKMTTKNEEFRKKAEENGAHVVNFEKIDEIFEMLPEKEADYLDSILALLIQYTIQDNITVRHAVMEDYNEYFDKYIRNSPDPDGEDKKMMKMLSDKYVMPEEVIDVIINNG